MAKIMNKKFLVYVALLVGGVTLMASCSQNQQWMEHMTSSSMKVTLIIPNLLDNPVVARYHIEYTNCKTVTDTLIKKGSAYF